MSELPATWTEKLLDVTSAFSRARTTQEVGEVAVGLGVEALGAVAGALALVSRDGAELYLVAGSSLPGGAETRTRRGVEENDLLSDAAREGATVTIESPEELARRYPDAARGLPWGEGTRMALPLAGGGRLLGVLGLGFATWTELPGTSRAFAQALASQCAQALERARLLDAEKEARRRLAIMADAAEAFSAPDMSLKGVLEAIARRTSEATGDGCVLRLLSDDGVWLDVRAAWAPPGAAESPSAQAGRIPAAEGLAGHALRSLETLSIPAVDPASLAEASDEERRAWLGEARVHSLILAPLHVAGRALGTLSVARTRPHEPHEQEDRLLVEGLSGRAASVIQKARLYDEIRRNGRLLEETLAREQAARKEAETANRSKDEFLAMLGHELRNPLSPMLTALELMKLRGGEAHQRERTIVERQVQHLVRLVDDLLDVSRITRGKVALKRRPVELHEVVASALEMASPLLESRRHRLVTSVPRAGLLVEADPHRLAQVFANLLMNSAKYTEPGGTVEVRGDREASQVVLRVRDSGMGIAPDLLPRVFDLFVQAHSALDRSQGGLGLGLTIVRTLVQMHGGVVRVASAGQGKGSEFTVELPALDASALVPRPPPPTTAPRGSLAVAQRVLGVDDNVDAAEALGEALSALGYSTATAFDGPGALDAAAKEPPQVAFLDIGLPVMDGYELARRLRELLGPSVKLVALTGYGQDHDRARSLDAGFDEHLVKPVELARIEALLHRVALPLGGAASNG